VNGTLTTPSEQDAKQFILNVIIFGYIDLYSISRLNCDWVVLIAILLVQKAGVPPPHLQGGFTEK
jgi:hypothetical protein